MNTTAITVGAVHKLPADLRTALLADGSALERWEDLTPLARNEWICWVVTTKKLETRANHIQRIVTELMEGKRRPCCWAGCMHRTRAALLNMKKNQNQNGIVHTFILLGITLVLVVSASYVTYSRQHSNSQNHATQVASKPPDAVTLSPVKNQEVKTPQLATASEPQPVNQTPTPVVKKTTATMPTPTFTPTPVTVLTPFISITSDGCQVAVNGATGNAFTVDVYSSRKGGTAHYHLPASGTYTVTTGGIKDMTVMVQLYDTTGAVLLSKYGTITVDGCPAAPAEN